LKHPGFSLFNLTPKDSCVSFEADLSHYSQLYVLAYDTETFGFRIFDLPEQSKLATRDLSL